MKSLVEWLSNKKTFLASSIKQLIGLLALFGIVDAIPAEVSGDSINHAIDNLAGLVIFVDGLVDMFQRIGTQKAQKAAEDANRAATAARLEAASVSNAIVGPPGSANRGFSDLKLMAVIALISLFAASILLSGCTGGAGAWTYTQNADGTQNVTGGYTLPPKPVSANPVRVTSSATVTPVKVSTAPAGYVCEGGYCYKRY